jgi:hypothetical protein
MEIYAIEKLDLNSAYNSLYKLSIVRIRKMSISNLNLCIIQHFESWNTSK